jgi:hypothetical protein
MVLALSARDGRPDIVSFSQTSITSVNPPVQNGSQLLLSWISSAPDGTIYQVYLDQQLVWSGVGLSCSIPLPTAISRIDIGTVGSADTQTNFQAELPPAPARQATLSWLGGTYQGADIAGFHIYGEQTPGGGIDYTTNLATVPAYVAGIITDGFGYGGFGQGGFGQSSGSYSWTSQALSGGTWNWGVKPFDSAGNEGSAETTAVTIAAPPLPPAPFPNSTRLQYTYTISTNQATLNWNASTS